ncbi:MAG TPA: DUF5679 domain-containing protein [Candidatus Nanoarchaeia archaeon]|nr:DUF5679 domain-containing protein [Candidatus Nanoarchaeia archaeon]
MVEGYCVKCKAKSKMKDPVVLKTARGGFMAQGLCVSCGTKMSAMMSEEKAMDAIKQGAKKSF